MQSDNYWKDKYKSLLDESKKKEENFQKLLYELLGLVLEQNGLGAGTNLYIEGSAEANGNEKGAPDFKIKDTNIFIEITGPLKCGVLPKSGLWIRPDKLKYAHRHTDTEDEWFALYFSSTHEWWTIHADKQFFEHLIKNWEKQYRMIEPVIRGVKEKYVEIDFDSPFIKDLQELLAYLSKYATGGCND